MHPDDRYSGDILARPARAQQPVVDATIGLVVEDQVTGFCGAVLGLVAGGVVLEDRLGRRRQFPFTAGAFLIDGRPVTLRRPRAAPAAPRRSASGSVAVPRTPARIAQGSRIWVEGVHDATLIERIWGHDLRVEGIVVEPLDGLDNLPAAVADFAPDAARRIGVLADHLVDGSKESHIARQVFSPHVLVTGHPYVDIWQAVRPAAVGIAAWPTVSRGRDWKTGVCAALGFADTAALWARIDRSVHSYRDIETPLITAVEQLIDFVTS